MRKIDLEIKNAKEFNAKGKKREALTCIKRKKMYEKQVEQISGAKITMETQRLALEQANMNREVLDAQREGAAALKKETQKMGGVDAVEETMDDVEEGLQDADEIGQAMARGIGPTGLDADEDDLLAELEQLEQDDVDSSLLSTGLKEEEGLSMPSAPFSAPSAPSSTPASRQMTDEERELAELEASMAM